MKNPVLAVAAAAAAIAVAALAHAESPYVGQEAREFKALSQQEIEDYLNGNGQGYAKAAELNQYPGPRHVLELARQLALTEEQAARTQAVFDVMKARASLLGTQLVEKERELDQRFASGAIDADSLEALLSEIGDLQASIRLEHLSAHLEQKALLTRHQIQLYEQLRGYGTSHTHE